MIVLVVLLLGEMPRASCAGSLCKDISSRGVRPHSISVTEFGAVGDGVTLNTKAFENAVFYASSFAELGGAQLYIPAGRWLTGSIIITSHLTLLLDKDAHILGSTVSLKHTNV